MALLITLAVLAPVIALTLWAFFGPTKRTTD